MNELKVTEYRNVRVVTTEQIAEAYGTDKKTVSHNFTRNKERYTEGKHYFLLSGNELRTFRQNGEYSKNAPKLYLWTERGALLLAKSINTDTAWEAYERLVDFYFEVKGKPTQQNIPAQNGTPIRLYPNSKWYILTIGDEIYSLKPEEAVIINKCVAAMIQNGASRIIAVVHALIEGFGRDCRLEPKSKCVIPKTGVTA